jgi:hypothetical protein
VYCRRTRRGDCHLREYVYIQIPFKRPFFDGHYAAAWRTQYLYMGAVIPFGFCVFRDPLSAVLGAKIYLVSIIALFYKKWKKLTKIFVFNLESEKFTFSSVIFVKMKKNKIF